MTTKTSKKPIRKKGLESDPRPKKRPLPTNKAGDKALIALAQTGHNRGTSQFLIGRVAEIEKLEDQRRSLNKAINGIYAECKQNGFSVKATRYVVGLRRLDKEERAHHEENIAIVKECLGEQLTMWDRNAIGRNDEEKPVTAPPEEVARQKAAVAGLKPTEETPLH